MSLRHHPIAVTFLLLGSACGSHPESSQSAQTSPPPQPTKAPAASEAKATPEATGELELSAPSGWILEKPLSKMRKAQYMLPRVTGDADDASLVVYYFGSGGGGGREANLARWAGQFEQPDGTDSSKHMKSADRTVNGLAVTDVELSGTYVAETTPGSGERVRKENWRMLASIVEGPAGPYYLKLVGPAETVQHWQPSYKTFVDALKAAP